MMITELIIVFLSGVLLLTIPCLWFFEWLTMVDLHIEEQIAVFQQCTVDWQSGLLCNSIQLCRTLSLPGNEYYYCMCDCYIMYSSIPF